MKKVLLVEDYENWIRLIKTQLSEKVEVITAETIQKAYKLFKANPDIKLVIMDACVPGSTPNTMNLIEDIIKDGFTNPIIAMSCTPRHIATLILSGATHSVENKAQVACKVEELLNLK